MCPGIEFEIVVFEIERCSSGGLRLVDVVNSLHGVADEFTSRVGIAFARWRSFHPSHQ